MTDDGTAPDAIRDLGRREATASAAFLRGVLPEPLRETFGERFVRSHHLYGELVCRLVLGIARRSGMAAALAVAGSPAEVVERSGFAPSPATVPVDWMLRFLASRGWIDRVADGDTRRYRATRALPDLDPEPVREEQRAWDASWMPAYVLAETVARDYPAFLRGEIPGEDVLFAPRRLRLWVDYFSNDNGLYAVNNRVGAVAAADASRGGDRAILELGGGLASGALALLDELEARGRLDEVAQYRFTEPVSAFLRRGEQTLRDRHPALRGLSAGSLDMNEPFGAQGVPGGSASLVYAVNTVHAARDLRFTLGEIRRALAPGGHVVLAECVPPPEPIYAELVFNLAETFRAPRLDPRLRPHGGFLEPEYWTAALDAAGFAEVRVVPDLAAVRAGVPDFSVAALVAARLA